MRAYLLYKTLNDEKQVKDLSWLYCETDTAEDAIKTGATNLQPNQELIVIWGADRYLVKSYVKTMVTKI